jgi:ectoine hydroxylase-related dioxygenase (phytanoyl-CoA dioxygenase family)
MDIRKYIKENGFDEAFKHDGAICLKGVFDTGQMDRIREVFEWYRAHPSPMGRTYYDDDDGYFFQDGYNHGAWPLYEKLFQDVPYGDIVAALWDRQDAWFFADQIFIKEGGDVRRTPWHQDLTPSYYGSELAVVWTSLDPIPKENALEFVRGSHLRTIYNQSAFDPADDTRPLFEGDLPRLPNIESERDKWDIISWATEPGDVLVFHHGTLHGGGKTDPCYPRRTLVARFIGEEAWRSETEAASMYDREDSGNDTALVDQYSKYINAVPPGQRLNTNPSFFSVRPLEAQGA